VLWNGTDGVPRRDVAWGFVALGFVVEVDVSKTGQSQALESKLLGLQWYSRKEVVGGWGKKKKKMSAPILTYLCPLGRPRP
jgi:hypothetical protein